MRPAAEARLEGQGLACPDLLVGRCPEGDALRTGGMLGSCLAGCFQEITPGEQPVAVVQEDSDGGMSGSIDEGDVDVRVTVHVDRLDA